MNSSLRLLTGIAAGALIAVVMTACASLPQEPSVADSRAVYVWPTVACPSAPTVQARPAIAPLVAAVAGPLLTDIVSGVVGEPVAALQAAANADASGFKASGQNARMFFPSVTTDSVTKKVTYTAPGCFVVAYSRYIKAGGSADQWCSKPEFAKALPVACRGGKAILQKIGKDSSLPGYSLDIPDFYLEIELQPSDYSSSGFEVVRPVAIAAYYPDSLLQKGSPKLRTVTVSLTVTSPGSPSQDVMKAASLSLVLLGVKPGSTTGDLSAQQTSWIVIPTDATALGANAGVPKGDGTPYYPVNITANLSEIGDPNAFLAAFAKAVSGSAGDYTNAIVNSVPAIPTAATQQASVSGQATLESAEAAASADDAKLLAACNPKPTTASARQAALAAYQTVIADRLKANAAALALTPPVSAPYPTLEQGLQDCSK